MAERRVLLALMRRIRRLRRWTAAVEGAAVGVALGGPLLAALAIILPRAAGMTVGRIELVVALSSFVVIGAAALAFRRIPLLACARGVDRALQEARGASAPDAADDCVFAAVALAREPAGTTSSLPFVEALTTQATARALTIPPRRIVPPPAKVRLALAGAGLGVLMVALVVPVPSSRASTAKQADGDPLKKGHAVSSPVGFLPAVELESEQEQARRAAAAGRVNADVELTRLADDFEKLLLDLANPRGSASAVVPRLQQLAEDANGASEFSSFMKSSTAAAAAALAAARGVGPDAVALSAGMEAPASSNVDRAGEAARRLATRGESGRVALGAAAAAAAAALPKPGLGAGSGAGTGDNGRGDDRADEQSPRRLDQGAKAATGTKPADSNSGARADDEAGSRRLQRLRRELEQSAADCRTSPHGCEQGARDTGRSLADMHREGRTARARQQLAEAARDLLDRLRRNGAATGDRAQIERFARAAGGAPEGGRGRSVEEAVPAGGQATPGAGAIAAPGAAAHRGSSGDQSADQPGDDAPAGQDKAGTGPAASGGHGAGAPGAAGGGGFGKERGGRVLGARSPAMGASGRDTPARVTDDSDGPSRAQIIGGASARGFASAEYQRVFGAYQTAMEESLEATDVPPGRRYLVRRYFQLIRPRVP